MLPRPKGLGSFGIGLEYSTVPRPTIIWNRRTRSRALMALILYPGGQSTKPRLFGMKTLFHLFKNLGFT